MMRNVFRYGVLLAILGGSLAFPAWGDAQTSSQQGKVFKWRGAAFNPKGMAGGDSFFEFCRLVKEMSGGRLEITPYLGGTLVSGNETFNALKSGVVEVGALYAGYYLGRVPEANLEAGPTGILDRYSDELDFWYYDGGGNKYMREIYAPHNIYFLGFSLAGPLGLISKKPIRSVADLKGMKIRTAGALAALSEQLGAKTVNIPVGEVYTALQTGVADGASYSDLSSFVAVGWHEVAKYAISGFYKKNGGMNTSVNMNAWNSLPEDLKAIMHTAQQIECYLHHAYEVSRNIEAQKKMEKAGCKIITLSAQDELEVAKARQRVWASEEKKGPRFEKAYKIYKEWMLKRGYPKIW